MILSDRTIREELAAGRIIIDPIDESCIQPSSVDLHLDRYFRVFLNHTMGHIDVKQDLEDLTELVEIDPDGVFMLHPGEFVLGSTLERVALPVDIVARLEGKSSLGRLGLLIHSSLPAGEPVTVLHHGQVQELPIGEIVRKRLDASVVAFDPDTGDVGFHPITGWYEGPPDRIFEVRIASGRTVRVTAGHNLFTPDFNGRPRKARTLQLGTGVAIGVTRGLPPMPDVFPYDRRATGAVATEAATIAWHPITEIVDTGSVEPVFDLEVRPGGRKVENFLAGSGGVFVSNTAGFVDAGWDGHLTLELSNVANLPITLYPGMKIGQISFLRMTTPADVPYGSEEIGSKYQGQRGPTPSRYWENFRTDDTT